MHGAEHVQSLPCLLLCGISSMTPVEITSGRPTLRAPYGFRYKVVSQILRKMPSEFSDDPFATNKDNGFTAPTCKITNIFRVAYGFTGRGGDAQAVISVSSASRIDGRSPLARSNPRLRRTIPQGSVRNRKGYASPGKAAQASNKISPASLAGKPSHPKCISAFAAGLGSVLATFSR
jgi:hypothetical protein